MEELKRFARVGVRANGRDFLHSVPAGSALVE
jgi:hypothetical protein